MASTIKGATISVNGVSRADPRILVGRITHDFGSLAGAAEVAVSITVPGVQMGDIVLGASLDSTVPSLDEKIFWDVRVIAANTVEVKLTNQDATAVDFTVGVLKVAVLKV